MIISCLLLKTLHWRHFDHDWGPRLRLKSPATWLFTQSFIRAQIKKIIKAPRHWPLCGEFTGTGEFPTQRVSNAENVSIWWRHHDVSRQMCIGLVYFRSHKNSQCCVLYHHIMTWGITERELAGHPLLTYSIISLLRGKQYTGTCILRPSLQMPYQVYLCSDKNLSKWDISIPWLNIMSQIVFYFLHSTSVLSFHIDIGLTLSICTCAVLVTMEPFH